MYACITGNINMVYFFITNKKILDKIEINQEFYTGGNAILLAAKNSHMNIVKMLILSELREKINFDSKTNNEKGLLYYAYAEKQEDIVQYLLTVENLKMDPLTQELFEQHKDNPDYQILNNLINKINLYYDFNENNNTSEKKKNLLKI